MGQVEVFLRVYATRLNDGEATGAAASRALPVRLLPSSPFLLLSASNSVRFLCQWHLCVVVSVGDVWLLMVFWGLFFSTEKNLILCLLASKAPFYWLHCISFSLGLGFAAFALEHPLEAFVKNVDSCFGLCAHKFSAFPWPTFADYCCSAPEGLRCLLPYRSYFWIGNKNHLHHVYWSPVTAALTYESGIELSMSLRAFLFGLLQKSKRREGTEKRGTSPPSLTGPILFYRSHSAVLESSLTRQSTLFYMHGTTFCLRLWIQCWVSASSLEAGKVMKLYTSGEIAECSTS